jgi:hypothetical protein
MGAYSYGTFLNSLTMYTSYIGKTFLRLYNEREGTELSARDFFDEVFFPLFFDDERHLMHVHGSSFFQPMPAKSIGPNSTKHEAKRQRLHQNIQEGKVSGSTFVGYAAEAIQAVSSGQMSSISMDISSEEIYASWIGASFGIAGGGGSMLVNEPKLLWILFEGWTGYRKLISETPNLKGNQIDTWNAHWLDHALSRDFDPDYPTDGLKIYPEANPAGKMAIPSLAWTRSFFNLSKLFPQKTITANTFYYDKTNKTYGFVNLKLPEVSRLYQIRDKVFINSSESALTNRELESLAPFFNFRSACMQGTIGLKALEPADLRKYMPKGTFMYAQGKDFKFTEESSFNTYKLFKTWIIAMLNKTELLDLASKMATALRSLQDDRGKTVLANLAKELREAKNVKAFIEGLTQILEHREGDPQTFKEVVEQVLKMPSDNFPLFITLVRFEYQYQTHTA